MPEMNFGELGSVCLILHPCIRGIADGATLPACLIRLKEFALLHLFSSTYPIKVGNSSSRVIFLQTGEWLSFRHQWKAEWQIWKCWTGIMLSATSNISQHSMLCQMRQYGGSEAGRAQIATAFLLDGCSINFCDILLHPN